MLPSPRDLFRTTIELYRKEFWLFLGYAAWLLVPLAAFYFAEELPLNPVTTILIITTIILQLFVWLWLSVCLMKATVQIRAQKPVDQSSLSTLSLRRIQPLLCVLFLQGLIVLGGFLLLVIPSVIFWVWYSMAQVAVALDDKRPVEALAFSRSLVTGRFFAVLWRLLAGPVVIGLLYALTSGAILITLGAAFDIEPSLIFSETPPLWAKLIQSIIDIFFTPMFVIYSVLLYQDLKAHPVEKATPLA